MLRGSWCHTLYLGFLSVLVGRMTCKEVKTEDLENIARSLAVVMLPTSLNNLRDAIESEGQHMSGQAEKI